MKSHDLAKVFPRITGKPFDDLVEDIKRNGLRESITTYEGKILDGSNRHLACLAAGVEPEFVELGKGVDPIHFVASMNLTRRHLDDSQRASIAAKLVECVRDRGTPPSGDESAVPAVSSPSEGSVQSIADDANVSKRNVEKALKVNRESKSLAKAVDDGRLSVDAANRALALDEEDQEEVAAQECRADSSRVLNEKLKGPSKDGTGTTKKTWRKKGAAGKAKDDPKADPSGLNQESYAQLPLTVVDTSDATHLFGPSKTLGTLIPTKGYHLKLVSDKTPPSNFSKPDNKDEFGF